MWCVGVFKRVGERIVGKKKERHVAVINYRYDGDKTLPAHLVYDVPHVWRERKITAFMRDAKAIQLRFNTEHRPSIRV